MKQSTQKMIDLMYKAVPDSSFEIRFWDDEVISKGTGPAQFKLWFKNKAALGRIFADGFLGFGEGYMFGDIELEGDIQLLFKMGTLIGMGDNDLSLYEKMRFTALFIAHQNTLQRSRKNIAHHYDVGNDFYKLFLDEAMVYTCAYFKSPEDSLAQAQRNKFDHVCKKLLLKEGETLADLGCGWGGFLIYAAQNYGITGVGVTLSKMQCEFGNNRIKELGLEDKIRIELRDYRELTGVYDKVSSIGMLEHVGKKFMPVMAQKVKQLLKPKGVGLVHFIANDTPFPDDPWTLKYMFPGYHIPALSIVVEALANEHLSILDVENLRQHYVKTGQCWVENFESNVDKIKEMYDEVFVRQWRIYLNVGVVSFEHGGNRLFQILFTNGLNNDYPMTRDHLYE